MRILFLILLLSVYSFGQENRLVRQNELSDSLGAVRTLIGTGGVALPDSVIYTSELTPYVDKTTAQTITGQKNFSGTVKVGSDTSMILGYMDGSIRTGLHINQLSGHPYGQNRIFKVKPLDAYTGSWSLTTGVTDFIPTNNGVDHAINLGYNHDAAKTDKPQYGFQLEANYEWLDTITVYEWFSYFNSTPTAAAYGVRPLQMATYQYGSSEPYRYSSTIGSVADVFSISDETTTPMIEFRTQTYGASADGTTKASGQLQNAYGGNSLMYIQDSMWIYHSVNNMPWLMQADANDGSARPLMYLNDTGTYGNIVLGSSTVTPIDFQSSIYGTIYWTDESGLGEVPIYKETGRDRIYIGGNDGMVTNKIEVINIPQDTTGLEQLQFYIDPLTGSVQYTMPEDIATNGDFTDWTGTGKAATPDGWVFAPDPRDTTTIYIEQNPTGKLHFVWDDSSVPAIFYVKQLISTIGTMYGYSFVVSEITDTAIVYVVGNGVTVTSTGVYSGSFESVDNSKFQIISGYGAGSITLDNMRLWVIGGNIATPTYDVPVILDSLGLAVAPVIDTTGVTDGYVLKYVSGSIVYSPDISTSGSGTFNPDGTTIDTTAGGLARVLPAKVTKWDSVTTKITAAQASDLISDSLSQYWLAPVTTGSMTYSSDGTTWSVITADVSPAQLDETYSALAHTHTDMFDTLSITWGVLDTTYAGSLSGWKVPSNITITEISAYTDANTCTFNIEERGETTPNTAGTDVIGSDLVADTDQQETSTFTNATIAKDAWLVPVISATGDVSIFSISVRYIKQ